MKIFNVRFFGGTFIVALGLFLVAVGFASLFPPTSNILMGVVLLLVGLAITKFGFIIAKDEPPAGHKTIIDMLRRAKMLGKGYKD